MKKSTPEIPLASPIPFRVGSNGEFFPRPATARDRRAEREFRRIVDDRSRALGVSRREFIGSACGTAAALMVINQVYGCGGDDSGGGAVDAGGGAADAGYDIDAAATIDADVACDQLSGDELVFDVQTHHVDPMGQWRDTNPGLELFLRYQPQAGCGEPDPVDCFAIDHYVREVFVNSETAVAVLSAVPANPDARPLGDDQQAATREIVNTLASSQRLLTHGLVLPDQGQSQLDGMQRLAEDLDIAAWKTYPQFGGWWLDDEAVGVPMIERARSLGVNRICIHKGLSLPGFDTAYRSARDVGVVAAAYPDVAFVVYHSGYEVNESEGPYDSATTVGIDTLVTAMLDNGLGTGSNVYAELGSTWRLLMTSPVEAAHALGKLLLYVGEDRILWGTDSIWYGSPQDQIDAFRAFEIPVAMQDEFGYPALTATAKRKILGLNAAELYGVDPDAVRCAIADDAIAGLKEQARDRPSPRLRGYGPQTRREMLRFLRWNGGPG